MIPATMHTKTAAAAVVRLLLDPPEPKARTAQQLAELALQMLGHEPAAKHDPTLRLTVEAAERAIRERRKK